MSTTVIAAIVGGLALLYALTRKPASGPGPAVSPPASVIDLAAIQARAMERAAEVISTRIVDNAAARHVAEHSAASSPPASPQPPKE